MSDAVPLDAARLAWLERAVEVAGRSAHQASVDLYQATLALKAAAGSYGKSVGTLKRAAQAVDTLAARGGFSSGDAALLEEKRQAFHFLADSLSALMKQEMRQAREAVAMLLPEVAEGVTPVVLPFPEPLRSD